MLDSRVNRMILNISHLNLFHHLSSLQLLALNAINNTLCYLHQLTLLQDTIRDLAYQVYITGHAPSYLVSSRTTRSIHTYLYIYTHIIYIYVYINIYVKHLWTLFYYTFI